MSDVTDLYPRTLPSDEEEAFVVAKRRLLEAHSHLDELHLWLRREDLDGYDCRERLTIIMDDVDEALEDLERSLPCDREPPPDSGVQRAG